MIRESDTSATRLPAHRTIAFTSGKGGVGKSSLVLNAGLALARRGRRVVLLDGDLGLANLTVLLGLAPRFDLRHVIAGERRLPEIVVRGPFGLRLVPAGSGVAELAALDGDARATLLADLGEISATADYLLIDTGAGIGDTVLSLVQASDEAIVVTRPEPTALADAYALMKVVLARHGNYPFHVLVNLARDDAEGRQVHDALAQILMRFVGYRPGFAGCVPADPVVGKATVEQSPFVIAAPRSPAARALDGLAAALTGAPAPPGTAASFWERLVRPRGAAS
jgi:flagellar biosynthesis protein FlhG